MLRSATSKVMWVGRVVVFLVGLAVILALVVGVTSAAFAANGKPFLLGKKNVASAISTLVKRGPGPALNLQVRANQPPLKVNSTRKVARLNADKLDGQDASAFLGITQKAADSEQLDGQDSSAFAQANTNAFVRNNTYRVESTVGPGTALGDGTHRNEMSCLPGDRLLSGGPANINSTSTLLESFPASTSIWAVRIHKNGAADNFNTVVLCANQ